MQGGVPEPAERRQQHDGAAGDDGEQGRDDAESTGPRQRQLQDDDVGAEDPDVVDDVAVPACDLDDLHAGALDDDRRRPPARRVAVVDGAVERSAGGHSQEPDRPT